MDINLHDYGACQYDPLTARWNGVDALAEKFHSSGSYNYVLGNPVRLGDKDGRDTTVYVNFDPTFSYFSYRDNKKEFIDNLRYFFKKNGMTINVVETTRTFEQIKKKLDYTDQYLELSNQNDLEGEPFGQLKPGITIGNHSGVYVASRTFKYTDGGFSIRSAVNTSIHEVFHGYLQRATESSAPFLPSFQTTVLQKLYGFDEGDHYDNGKCNIMMSGDARRSCENPNGYIGIADIAPLRYNPFTQKSETNIDAQPIMQTDLLLPSHKKLIQGWFNVQLKYR